MKILHARHESEVPKMRRIGIIGGLSQWATMDFLHRLFQVPIALEIPQYGNRGYPPVDIRFMNKAPMLLNPDGSYPDVLQPSAELLEAAQFVGKNADLIVVTSNTAHLFSKEIEEASGKLLLSFVDSAVAEVKKRGYKRVGLLAIGVTLKEGLFQQAFQKHNISTIILPPEFEKKLEDEAIYPVQEGEDPQLFGGVVRDAVQFFRDQKTDGIVLGCTELPILLKDDFSEGDIINPSQLVAEAAVKWALQ